jgi:crotonobetainyl-CoA:carnitine CoA-transferase CaiB-like acyl-CoA transferase
MIGGEKPMSGPLAGYRIIDMTTVIMGPMATMMLGEMGADVIKIEAPVGDQTRNYAQAKNAGMGAIYLNLNRNKRSIVLDLKKPEGRDALLRLLAGADALVYSIRPKAMQRLGLGYDECRAVKPDLIYCGAYGFRQDGPYAARPAYDDIIQGLSGVADNLSWVCGAPQLLPFMGCDKTSGLYLVQAVMGGLLHRERTGEGQQIEVPMFELSVHFNLMEQIGGMVYVPQHGEAGYVRARLPNRKPFRTKDGYICILPGSTKHWQAFFRAVGRPELGEEPRITTPAIRYRSTNELYALVAEIAACWTRRMCPAARSIGTRTCQTIRISRRSATSRRSSTRRKAGCACPTSRSATWAAPAASSAWRPISVSTASSCCAKPDTMRTRSRGSWRTASRSTGGGEGGAWVPPHPSTGSG